MKPFNTVAIPHDDILQGRLTMDVFAADLWEVTQDRGADEYRDAETFFKKTYVTQGLDNLFSVVKKRLNGKGGDSFIQLQTPFGGGKTHALIALYHKANEWGSNRIVIDGAALSARQTIWGQFEQSLAGRIELCEGQVAPGKETIRKLLSAHQPLIILIDELLEYQTKAAGVTVGGNNLAAQTLAFMQELSETVGALEKVCLLVTLPASLMEHYDEDAEQLYQKLQKVSGRRERIYTPVEESEIASIIRQRLFTSVKTESAKEVVNTFVEYADQENILPVDSQPSDYRNRFLKSYPFMPEVIDILYHRWGSYHTFQRTRGVLRLLSLVIHYLQDSGKAYISLADFDLGKQELRQELLKHIGSEFNSIIGNDITSADSGSERVNASLGNAYRGLSIGTRTATTIFMYSFSGGQEHGANLREIKRSATTIQNPSPLVAEALEQLKTKLFYLQTRNERYSFSNQANLNRILLNNMENLKEADLMELEKELLRSSLKGQHFKTYIWEDESVNIVDSEEIKLVILPKDDKDRVSEILRLKGQTPRVYKNTVLFLLPLDSERNSFINTLKRKIALENITKDTHLKLSEEQQKEVKDELKKIESPVKEAIRRLYRKITLPARDGFTERDLGIPTYGLTKHIDEELFDQLKIDNEILESIAPLVLKEKYLGDKAYVLTEQLFQSTLKTPGEARPTSRAALEQGILEGVRRGVFGLGELDEERPKCVYYNEDGVVSFSGKEVIIKDSVCVQQKKEGSPQAAQTEGTVIGTPEGEPSMDKEEPKTQSETEISAGKTVGRLSLTFEIPKGKVAGIMGVMNLLQSKFDSLEINLKAKNGAISEQDIEDKIEEAFRQLNIDVKISND